MKNPLFTMFILSLCLTGCVSARQAFLQTAIESNTPLPAGAERKKTPEVNGRIAARRALIDNTVPLSPAATADFYHEEFTSRGWSPVVHKIPPRHDTESSVYPSMATTFYRRGLPGINGELLVVEISSDKPEGPCNVAIEISADWYFIDIPGRLVLIPIDAIFSCSHDEDLNQFLLYITNRLF